MSPCDEGTLVAAIAQRLVLHLGGLWSIIDSPAPPLYTATYQTDLQAQKIDVKWRKLQEGATGVVVQKIPVACWSMLESLHASIAKVAVARV